MAQSRCGCAGTTCSCAISGGNGISVSGSGSSTNPYVITFDDATFDLQGRLLVEDSPTVNLTLTGEGTVSEPWTLRADATLTLGDLTDVNASNLTAGYVLTRQNDGTFAMLPGSTAPAGSIISDNSLDGDGSVGAPLVVHDYANLARLEGSDATPNNQSIDFGSPTNATVRQIRINRATTDGTVQGLMRSFLTNSGAGNAQSATIQYLRNGTIVGSLGLAQTGNLTWSPDGVASFNVPYRIALGNGTVSFINQVADSATVTFPAGRFTSTPTVIASISTTGANNVSFGQFTIWTTDVSTTGATVHMRHVDGTLSSGNIFFRYIAIQL